MHAFPELEALSQRLAMRKKLHHSLTNFQALLEDLSVSQELLAHLVACLA